MKIFKRLGWALLALLFLGKVSLPTVHAFDSYVIHPALARAVALNYNNQNPNNSLSADEINWFIQGALEEDEPAIRALNHFYNPVKNEGLRVGGVVLGLSAPEWAYAQSQQQIELGGDCSWPTAIAAYQSGDKAKAFRCLGHVMHLMEDMGVPAHTRNDQHLIGDPFEQWAKYHNPEPADEAVSEPQCPTAKDCIINLGTWINKNFLSKNTINNLDFELPFNKATIEGEYLTANHLSLAVYNPKNKEFSLTAEIQAGYWQKISPMIKAYGKKLITIFLSEAKHQPSPPLQLQFPSETSISSNHVPPYIPSLTTVLNPSSTFKSLTEPINSTELIPTIIPLSPKKEISPVPAEKIIEPVPDTYVIKRPASTSQETTAQFIFSSDIPTARFECSTNIFSWFDCGSSYYITGLESGRHSLFVRAVNDTGYDLTPQYYSWLVDTTAPKTTLLSFTSKTSRQASFRFISEIGAKFDCQFDSEAWKECISPFTREELRSGTHSFSVRARDKVGNSEEEPVTYQWTIEIARPVSPSITFPEKTPYYTRLPEIIISGSAEPTLNVIAGTISEQKAVENGLNNWSYRTSLNIGENIFSFSSINHYGEESFPVSSRIMYDVESPEIKYFNLPEMNPGRDFSVSWEGNDNSNGLLTYDVMYRETKGEWQSWFKNTALTEAQFINEFPSENISFRIRAIDQAGNTSDWLEKNIMSIQIEETDHLVISQIIPKGRNGSTDEFIEIYNPTSLPISLQSFSFQKKSKSEIIWHAVVPAAQHELAVINSHGYYLLAGASYSYLTTPDITVMNELLHDDNGHVRIVNNLGIVVDRLGYGQANNPEINAAPQPSLGVSLHRKAQNSSTAISLRQFPNLGNGYDSNNNFNDFVLQAEILPKNSQIVF